MFDDELWTGREGMDYLDPEFEDDDYDYDDDFDDDFNDDDFDIGY